MRIKEVGQGWEEGEVSLEKLTHFLTSRYSIFNTEMSRANNVKQADMALSKLQKHTLHLVCFIPRCRNV